MNKLVFNKSIILNNILNFKNNTKDLTNLQLIFPVKTCTNIDVLKIFHNEGFGFDVSNQNELDVVSKFKGFKSFVGPRCNEIKYKYDENFIIYYDQLKDYYMSKIEDERKGVRVNFNSKRSLSFSHFGIDFKTIDDDMCKQIKNIHFHLGDTRSSKTLQVVLKEIYKILAKCTNLKTIDIGGGYEDFGNKDLVRFLSKIHSKLNKDQFLVLECGDFWFKNSGKLYVKVLNTKKISKDAEIVYLTISKDCNLKWSSPTYVYQDKRKSLNKIKYYFYGCSCYEKDLIGGTITHDIINTGDIIEFQNISHYSVEWNTSFNGIDKIEVYYE